MEEKQRRDLKCEKDSSLVALEDGEGKARAGGQPLEPEQNHQLAAHKE